MATEILSSPFIEEEVVDIDLCYVGGYSYSVTVPATDVDAIDVSPGYIVLHPGAGFEVIVERRNLLWHSTRQRKQRYLLDEHGQPIKDFTKMQELVRRMEQAEQKS